MPAHLAVYSPGSKLVKAGGLAPSKGTVALASSTTNDTCKTRVMVC